MILCLRLIVADVFIVLSYFGLFGFTFWQAVLVNDNVRYLHVMINDFVTEPASRLPSQLFEAVIQPWNYKSKQVEAKFFPIHSTISHRNVVFVW